MPSSELVMTKFGQMLAAVMAMPSEVCSALGSLLPLKKLLLNNPRRKYCF
jgi:hypothetical protein